MPKAVKMRDDLSADGLRILARRTRGSAQSRRLLSLAGVKDGMERGEAAKIGGMDRQTLRDWVHRFNALGPEGLKTVGRTGRRRVLRQNSWRNCPSLLRRAPI
jgi:transposase